MLGLKLNHVVKVATGGKQLKVEKLMFYNVNLLFSKFSTFQGFFWSMEIIIVCFQILGEC